MSDIRDLIWRWSTGGSVDGHDATVVVLADGRWLLPLLESGAVGAKSHVFVPDASRPDSPRSRRIHSYVGDFTDPSSELAVDSDVVVGQSPYSLAEFGWLRRPTVLRIHDGEDFSAYLRDADVAREEGRFPGHVVSGFSVMADLVALGAPHGPAGPHGRIFVFADGSISTSPTGTRLGRVGDPMSSLVRRWNRMNSTSAWPCAVSLSAVVSDQDRCDALLERPWLGRYAMVLRTLTAVPGLLASEGRPDRGLLVSGFGGRLVDPSSPEAPRPSQGERVADPVVFRADGDFLLDPVSLLVTRPASTLAWIAIRPDDT